MSDWVPLLQSLIWPAFLASLLTYVRTQVRTIMNEIATRVKAGDTVQVGPGGLTLGQQNLDSHASMKQYLLLS
jgi:hypothetical protein